MSQDPHQKPQTRGAPSNWGAQSFGLSFEVLAQIALGSTARVDLCRSLGPQQSGQLIAVKRPLPELVHDETVGKRFLDEVWMTAALRHPNVVGVVGWGQDDRGPYLAVELVQGVSVARLMKSVFETGEQFPERLVVYIGMAVARGLAAAHDLRSDRGEYLGLVHRDLSSANVLLSFQGEVKIADFGLAKAKDRLTVTTSELPSRDLSHVAPEELEQKPVDHRSDLFSFGTMLFELLTGRLPFVGKDDIALLEALLRKRAPDPMKLRPKLDPALGALVLRCLEKDPQARPQSAHDVARELEQWLYAHGYLNDSIESLSRFVRRNSMRQMRWFERVISGEPEPLPTPFSPRQPSMVAIGTTGKQTSSMGGASGTTNRDSEPTVVGGRRAQAPPPKRSRSSDAIPAAGRSRRSGSAPGTGSRTTPDPGLALDEGGIPSLMADDEGEDVPTVALRVDRGVRDEFQKLARERAAARVAPEPAREEARGPLETVRMEDPDSNQDPTLQKPGGARAEPPLHARQVLSPSVSLRDVDLDGQRARPAKPPVSQHIENELGKLRSLAMQRHEQAKLAREAAHRAALEAEQAESAARTVERALAGARIFPDNCP